MISIASDRPGGIDTDILKKGLHIIEKAAEDGVNILSRINQFTKSKYDLKLTQLDIREIIEYTVEMTRPKWQDPASSRKIEVVTNYDGNMNMSGDRAMMVEIFSNLIYNAVDATEKNGQIVISAEQTGGSIIIRLSDTVFHHQA